MFKSVFLFNTVHARTRVSTTSLHVLAYYRPIHIPRIATGEVILNESEYQVSLITFRNHHKDLYWAECREDDDEFKQIIEARVLLSQ